MHPWRLILDGALPAAENMARDEALLEALADEPSCPAVMRLYGWIRPSLSLGFEQPYASHVNSEFCLTHLVDIVRRPTGGRAVLHHLELTYALVFREDHPVLGGTVLESFRKVATGMVRGLRGLGVPADVVPVHRARKLPRAANCFMTPSAYEIAVDGRKLVGSAQVRRRGAVLQHGSILMDVDAALWEGVFADGSGADLSSLATLRGLGFEGPEAQVQAALVDGFSSLLGCSPRLDALTEVELHLASQLLTKHLSEAWIRRR